MARKKTDKQILNDWDEFKKNISRATPVDDSESTAEQEKRIKRLEQNPEEWFAYYFPNYYTATPAPFHIASSKRVIENAEWFEVRSWSRELAKSTRTMMEVLFLVLTGKKKNVLLVSNSYDNAERLLEPYKITLEANNRIINDYGTQQSLGSWESGEFTTKNGASFRALGAGQSPRGTRNEAARPDVILIDDIDTDEECRNKDRITQKIEWIEQALIPTRSISTPLLLLVCGNIIAKFCCVTELGAKADKWDIINIRDKAGKSTWPSKNTEADIDRVLSLISKASASKEYFNKPIIIGKVFKEIHYGKMQPLQRYKFLMLYTDPSYKKNGDYKASAMIGKYRDEYHVLWVKCQQTSTAKMLDWHYDAIRFVNNKTALYMYIEYPWIDEPLKLEMTRASKRHGTTLSLRPDERNKPEKFYRIESLLEPLNRNKKLIFNEKLKDTQDMEDMEFQFLALSPNSRANDDGPDAVEGAVWKYNNKITMDVAPPQIWNAPANQKRY